MAVLPTPLKRIQNTYVHQKIIRFEKKKSYPMAVRIITCLPHRHQNQEFKHNSPPKRVVILLNLARRRKRKCSEEDASIVVKCKRIRSVKRHKFPVRDKDRSLREIRPEDTLWYLLYVPHPLITPRMSKVFRLRFRLPYEPSIS